MSKQKPLTRVQKLTKAAEGVPSEAKHEEGGRLRSPSEKAVRDEIQVDSSEEQPRTPEGRAIAMKMTIFHVAGGGPRPLLGLWLIAAAALLFSVAPASAMTPSAGWSIGSVAEPTNFAASDTQDEVEKLVITATGGTYELYAVDVGEEFATKPIAWDASAVEVQQALEAVPQLNTAGMTVSGGLSGPPYTYGVSWTGTGINLNGRLEIQANNLTDGVNAKGEVIPGTFEQEQLQAAVIHDQYTVTVVNVGSRATGGEITVVDNLPAQVTPVEARIDERDSHRTGECVVGTPVKCTYSEAVPAEGRLLVTIGVVVKSNAPERRVRNEATVSGGGPSASTTETGDVNVGPASFGISQFAVEASGLDGTPDGQAGDHPYSVTTNLAFNTVLAANGTYEVAQEVKDVAVTFPPGFYGDPLAIAQCPEVDLTDLFGSGESEHTSCPPASQVGTVRLVWQGGSHTPGSYRLYNMIPEPGYPAELGFNAGLASPILLYASLVPGPNGYRLRVASPGALRHEVEEVSITIFGDPADHDGTGGSAAFVTNPMDCSTAPLSVSAEATSWEGGSATAESTAYPDVTGCDLLQGAAAFDPSVGVEPETTQAETPSGYEVNLKLPQAPEVFGAPATPELKNATVTLPAGVSVSPAAASGPDALEGCTEAQIDLLGTEVGEGHPGGNGSPYDDGLTHASPGHCPENSRIGEVELKTPLLEEPLHGHVYLAEPHCGGAGEPECTEPAAEEGKVFGLYLEMAGSGVIVKLVGSVEAGGYGAHSLDTGLAPGQLRTRFDNNPQLPFEELKLTFTGGQRAPLENPQSCGTFTTTSELEPWSAPESGPNATPSSAFAVTGCASPMPFKPELTAGTLTPIAGGFSPFTLRLTRQDGEQDFAGVSLTTPAGLEGMLSKVALCGEPQAALGTCASASQIGTATVASGAGTQPLWLSGPVYLTGSYKGAPFGLSIVVPAKAGPFNLGNVVVRSSISVNPDTAQLTVTSDPLPLSIDGVPFRLKTIDVEVNRPEFMFNPTNCGSQSIGGTITAAQGASSTVASPFAATGCRNLPFKPGFTASTQGTTSKADGASLVVKVTQKPGEANIHRVDLQLPLALPSRLTTLQKACGEAQFDANPAGCPAGSVIGTATAVTPVLNVPLMGPAYLVSHGGAAFPDVEFVLQGQGVTIVLDGKTQIKNGITYSHFETIPDAPISSFETTLPEGPNSVLATNIPANAHGRFCGLSLAMPTTIEGQNGAQLKQSTTIAVTGCTPAIKVVEKKRSGGQVLLTLRSTVAGTLTITGRGVKTTRQTVAVGEHQVKVALTSAGRRRKTIMLRIVLKSGKMTLSKVM